MLLADGSSFYEEQERDFQEEINSINVNDTATSIKLDHEKKFFKLSTKRMIWQLKEKVLKLQKENSELKKNSKGKSKNH